jgi:hypothetical protein
VSDLAGALDAALRARYRVAEVRTPVTQRRGLLGRMNQLEKLHARKGDKPGQAATRAAEASGIPARTWRDWRKGTHPPSAANARKLEGAYSRQVTQPAFLKSVRSKKAPKEVRVTGTIRWTDSPRKRYNASPHRTTVLTGMGPTMAAVVRAWVAAGPEAAADAFQRGASAVYKVVDDDDGTPGIKIEGDEVTIEFPGKD